MTLIISMCLLVCTTYGVGWIRGYGAAVKDTEERWRNAVGRQ